MKNSTEFKPFLAPNESVDLSIIKYPIFGSTKLDGIRCIFMNDGRMLARSLKPFPNKQLNEKYKPLMEYCKLNNIILDGEFYSPSTSFQMIQTYTRTEDWDDKQVVKKYGNILNPPSDFGFHCFDILPVNIYASFRDRYLMLENICKNNPLLILVNQTILHNKTEVDELFIKVLNEGYEGLMLKSLNGRYKFGRATINEGIVYKVKPFVTFDAQIIDVTQATQVREGTERTINELGRSVTSKKKDDRVLINRAACFRVIYEGNELDVTIAMTNEEKEEIWSNKQNYIGKWIEYKAMLVGSKDVPRHAVMIRFRDDKQ